MMGLLVAAYVVTQQACDFQEEMVVSEIAEDKQANDDEENQPINLQMLSQQMLPAVSVEIEPFEAVYIREIFVDSEVPMPFNAEVPLEDTHFFKTLFRQIQSPNAP